MRFFDLKEEEIKWRYLKSQRANIKYLYELSCCSCWDWKKKSLQTCNNNRIINPILYIICTKIKELKMIMQSSHFKYCVWWWKKELIFFIIKFDCCCCWWNCNGINNKQQMRKKKHFLELISSSLFKIRNLNEKKIRFFKYQIFHFWKHIFRKEEDH